MKMFILQVVYEDYEMIELCAPYIPGFLGFREVPFICGLFDKLRQTEPQFLPQVGRHLLLNLGEQIQIKG